MKATTVTIRIDKDLDDLLTEASRRTGRSRTEIARQALRRCLRENELDALRQKMTPYAEARGYLTDEDVFDEVS